MGSDESVKELSYEARYYEARTFLLLGITFFLVIAAYTLTREIKESIFAFTVGREYIPYAKLISMVVLVPAILFYAKLVDSLRRYYLICVYTSFYAIGSVIFAYFLGHPVIGLANTDTSPHRLFGWLFYFFIEGYSPFVVSVFWAFANSITNPEAAKKRYGYMVSYSKVGGMVSAATAWCLLSWQLSNGMPIFSDIVGHQLILYISAIMLSLIPFVVFYLIRTVPGRFLHGYEAVYKVEKEKSKQDKQRVGLFDGLRLLIKYPYVLGIFGMVFFYEVIATVLGYLRLAMAQSHSSNIAGVSGELYKIIFLTHFVGFFITIFGTTQLLRRLGERWCLLLIPGLSGVLLILFILSSQNSHMLVAAFVGIKAVNYAFSWPVRESLYIPTIKEIKFKSKSWIDAFGSKFGKSSGGVFNSIAEGLPLAAFLSIHAAFFCAAIGLWFVTAYILGSRFERAVEEGEVIGAD